MALSHGWACLPALRPPHCDRQGLLHTPRDLVSRSGLEKPTGCLTWLFQSELEGKVDVEVAILANLRVIEEWEELFSSFDCCISGRLHQVLPAAAVGVPSVLIAPEQSDLQDTRYTLIEDLELPTASLSDHGALDLPGLCGVGAQETMDACRLNLTTYLEELANELAT